MAARPPPSYGAHLQRDVRQLYQPLDETVAVRLERALQRQRDIAVAADAALLPSRLVGREEVEDLGG
eukprot:1179478-Prymnesium_polylepis.1